MRTIFKALIYYNSVSVLCFGFLATRHMKILAPLPGFEPATLALEGEVLTIGPPRKSLAFVFKMSLVSPEFY